MLISEFGGAVGNIIMQLWKQFDLPVVRKHVQQTLIHAKENKVSHDGSFTPAGAINILTHNYLQTESLFCFEYVDIADNWKC